MVKAMTLQLSITLLQNPVTTMAGKERNFATTK